MKSVKNPEPWLVTAGAKYWVVKKCVVAGAGKELKVESESWLTLLLSTSPTSATAS